MTTPRHTSPAARLATLLLGLLAACGGGGGGESPSSSTTSSASTAPCLRWLCPPATTAAPSPATPPASAPAPTTAVNLDATGQLGVYVGNEPLGALAFETWLGRQVSGVQILVNDSSWADFDASVPWLAQWWSGMNRPLYWSLPLIPHSPSGATLAQAATGAYNDHYRRAAEAMWSARPQDARIYVRIGWNANGNWIPWSAQGRAADYIGAYRQAVQVFRSVALARGNASRFVYEWNVAAGDHGMNPADAYPGDDVVDIIGMDFRWIPPYDAADPVQAWNELVARPYGLQWHQTFATAHGKRTAYSNWGVRSNIAGPYIQRAKAWFDQHGVVYNVYADWDVETLSTGQLPAAASTYRSTFGS
jgi:hypothetical protein